MKISTDLVQNLLNLGVLQYDQKFDRCVINPSVETLGWEVSLGFEHVAIRQKKNRCNSRLEVDTTSEVIKDVNIKIPMIASNMSTVCDADFCIKLGKLGAMGVMHRAASDEEIFKSIEKMAEELEYVAGSVGVGESQIVLADNMIERGCNIIFIDIAHGYSDSVIETGRSIKHKHPDVKIVIGNTTNIELLYEVKDFADAIKIGIATGFCCETKNTAGCTEKQFSAVLKFKKLSKDLYIPVISDGGIREPADMVKAIGAGANSVMAGSIFARCPESAGPVVSHPTKGHPHKLYAGMASRWTQERWKNGLKDGTCPEGGVRYLGIGEPLEPFLKRWRGALMSGITYGGGKDIQSFQNEVEFVKLAT
jgi:IMP dehydrogenase